MSDVVISVEKLSKKYIIGRQQERYSTLRDAIASTVATPFRRLGSAFRSSSNGNAHSALSTSQSGDPSPSAIRNSKSAEEFWALKDISLEVKQGEVLGVIGRNGAGKSTLLKILSRITEPTRGRVRITGRVASLLEVGTGFHPELTGRENIYLNGAILGMSREEIKRKFDEIVAFAEIEKFIETPVKRYSSGMYVRLAFAVAAHLEPEILLVDEVLAVGDYEFQRRCLGKMNEVAHGGRTVLLVSHNMAMLEYLCNRAVLLDGGVCRCIGTAREAIDQYTTSLSRPSGELTHRGDRLGSGRLRITHFRIMEGDTEKTSVRCGAPVTLEVTYDCTEDLQKLRAHIVIDTLFGDHVMYLGTDLVDQDFSPAPPSGTVKCTFPRMPLVAGAYIVNLYCVGNDNEDLFDGVLDAARFEVVEGDYFGSGRLPPSGYAKFVSAHVWAVE